MKIMKKTGTYSARFRELGIGDCFELHGDLYMRIVDGDEWNTVCLQDGVLTSMFEDEIIFPANTELTYTLCALDDL